MATVKVRAHFASQETREGEEQLCSNGEAPLEHMLSPSTPSRGWVSVAVTIHVIL